MARCVAFDLAQLFIGLEKRTPRGIDRVDLAYARHFLENWRGDCVTTLPTPWGIRWFDRERSLRAVNHIEDHWGETDQGEDSTALRWTKSRIRGERPAAACPRSGGAARRSAGGFVQFARRQGLALGRPVRSLPPETVYLNTGQVTLGFPRFFGWLRERKDIEAVIMLHDVIPIEYPEYCTPFANRLHHRALENTARHAARLIVTTEAAGQSIRRELGQRQREDIPMIAAPLPVPSPFLAPTVPEPDICAIPYFVATGAIAPHKNHLLLLNVWRELVRIEGDKSPKLVLVGSRSNTSPAVVSLLERCEALKDHVLEVPGLTTPALRELLAGARALLMPSFAEGFGLPIVEAQALATPVIASDLPSLREAGGGRATYIDPIDGLGWLSAIRAHARGEGIAAGSHAAAPPAWTYEDYFARVEPFITGDL
jgi:glycosyltransferase involved in cell wall biosynthesis